MPPQDNQIPPAIPSTQYAGGMERIDNDEQVLAVIHRHPFGLVGLYIEAGLAVIMGAVLLYFLLHGLNGTFNVDPQIGKALMIGGIIITIFIVLILMVATSIYRKSELIITNKTVTQILQKGLFNRKVSQLSLEDIEDVNMNVKGVMQTMFKFGTLNVETAGEADNFVFRLCPKCDSCAKLILEARQRATGRDTHA